MAKRRKGSDDLFESEDLVEVEEAVVEEGKPVDGPKKEATSDIEKKAEVIRSSSMPEAQKESYLRKIGALAPDSNAGKVPFHVYAKLRKTERDRINAMRVYPKASLVRLATLKEWDEIFKDF